MVHGSRLTLMIATLRDRFVLQSERCEPCWKLLQSVALTIIKNSENAHFQRFVHCSKFLKSSRLSIPDSPTAYKLATELLRGTTV